MAANTDTITIAAQSTVAGVAEAQARRPDGDDQDETEGTGAAAGPTRRRRRNRRRRRHVSLDRKWMEKRIGAVQALVELTLLWKQSSLRLTPGWLRSEPGQRRSQNSYRLPLPMLTG